ncbi:MAG: histidinol-phosphatase [Tissierellia bacterium]|jgi:histidinol-phosphatase (PHP family)|nr:histidinol-phosphatase [Tissierellia bacterium]
MHLNNLHTHTIFCDGKNTPEEMVLGAINHNFNSLGFSSHGPVEKETYWNIKRDKIEEYIEVINSLKVKYMDKIEILLGMELEYFPGIGFTDECMELSKRLDYYIGSVHYLGTLNNGELWAVDDFDIDVVMRGINESFQGNSKKAVETYYEALTEMAEKYQPPIIGHFDLIKKNNKDNILFDESEDWYIRAVENCLNIIKKTSSAIEINTGGIARKSIKDQYPSTFILEMIKDRNIPIIVSSDAHNRDDIACKFDDMFKLLYDIGFENLVYLTKHGWEKQKININE